MAATTVPGLALGASLTRLVLGAGPLVSVAVVVRAVAGGALYQPMLGWALVAVLVAWSPLPVSIPAVLLGGARDAALPELTGLWGGLVRGVRLLPHLASVSSPVRVEVLVSLASFAAAAGWSAALVAA